MLMTLPPSVDLGRQCPRRRQGTADSADGSSRLGKEHARPVSTSSSPVAMLLAQSVVSTV